MASLAPSCGDVEKFESALFSVLFREQGVQIDTIGRLACPVQSYLAFVSLWETGQFVKAGLVTQPISRFLYLSRAVVLRIALRDCSGEETFLR